MTTFWMELQAAHRRHELRKLSAMARSWARLSQPMKRRPK